MYKKQQDRKQRKSSVPRYFRRNEGTTDYISIPGISTPADYEIEFNINTTDTTECALISLFTANTTEQLSLVLNSSVGNVGALKLFSIGVTPGAGTKIINDGLTHTVNLSKSGNVFTLMIDGAVDYVINHGNPSYLASSYSVIAMASKSQASGSVAFTANGVMSNLKYINNGTPSRNYPINDNGNTIRDTVSGQDGAVVNGNANDWGLFKNHPTLWRGQNLSVPPWDSVDQVLVKA